MPTALSYGMPRAEGIRPASDDDLDHRRDRAFVDGLFLLHLLLYLLNHSKLNIVSYASTENANMERILNTKSSSHREKNVNLLGWVFLYKVVGLLINVTEGHCAQQG